MAVRKLEPISSKHNARKNDGLHLVIRFFFLFFRTNKQKMRQPLENLSQLEINRTENRVVPSGTSEVKQLVTRNNGCSLLLAGSSRLTEHAVFLLLLPLRPNQSPRVTTLMVKCFFYAASLNQDQVTFVFSSCFCLCYQLAYASTPILPNITSS